MTNNETHAYNDADWQNSLSIAVVCNVTKKVKISGPLIIIAVRVYVQDHDTDCFTDCK